jgi:hypothetical protein
MKSWVLLQRHTHTVLHSRTFRAHTHSNHTAITATHRTSVHQYISLKMGDSTGSGISYHKMYMDLKTETIINTMKMEEKIRNLEAQLAEKQRNAPNTGALQSQLASKNRELAEKNRTIREQQGKIASQKAEIEEIQQQNYTYEFQYSGLSAAFEFLKTKIDNIQLVEEALQHAEKQLQSKYHQDDVEDEMREVCDVIDAEADAHLAAQLHEECSVQEYADTVY